jgi:hypothetical protein
MLSCAGWKRAAGMAESVSAHGAPRARAAAAGAAHLQPQKAEAPVNAGQEHAGKVAHVREHSTLSTERWGTLGHSLFSPCQRDASAGWCCAAAAKGLARRRQLRAGAKRGRAPSTRQGGAPTEAAACAVAGCGDATCMQRSRGRHAL